MRRRRHRYTSPAKRRLRKRLLLIAGVVILLLLILLFALPTITGGRVALLPFQKGHNAAKTPSPSKTPFRWPWQKEEEEESAQTTPAPSLQPMEESVAQSAPPMETPQSAVSIPRASYPIQLDIALTEGNRVQIVEQITHTNASSHIQSEVQLHFPAISLMEGGLTRLTLDGLVNELDYSIDPQSGLMVLPLNQPLLPGESLRITFSYILALSEGNPLLSYDSEGGSYVLSNFYAYLAAYDENSDAWYTDVSLGLPLQDVTANVTMSTDYTLANSGRQASHASLSTGNQRVRIEDMASQSFALATGAGNLRNETVTQGEFSITNYAPRSSTVVRISELSQAILQYYSETHKLGMPAADGNGVNVLSTTLDQPCVAFNNLILYNADSFSDTNEFRYQYAVALARLYFPAGASIDENTEAFNELLCSALAASYVESSQSEELAEIAYAHAPEGRSLIQVLRDLPAEVAMPDYSMGDTLYQYYSNTVMGIFDIQSLYAALPASAMPSVESLLLSYRQRTEGGMVSAAVTAPMETAEPPGVEDAESLEQDMAADVIQ